MIPRKLVREATLLPVDVEVIAANGTTIQILGSMRVAFEIQGHPFSANLLVSEDIGEFMLGFDWLKLNEAEWNFGRKTLSVRGLEIPLKVRKSRASVRRVYVRERIVIPPNTEQNVSVKLVNSSFRTPTSEWLVDPCTLAEKVFVARVLLSNEDKHAALRIVNLSDKQFDLQAGAELGCAVAAEVLHNISHTAGHGGARRGTIRDAHLSGGMWPQDCPLRESGALSALSRLPPCTSGKVTTVVTDDSGNTNLKTCFLAEPLDNSSNCMNITTSNNNEVRVQSGESSRDHL